MQIPDEAIHIETDDARGGTTPNIVRWVLGISLTMAILALSAIWMLGALSVEDQPDPAISQAATTPGN